eukprot:TRINITY_DN6422_c0_g2_i1.p1 TRINITY_DN6422_c0_g2~~TRINITY_DN6422_c0_g2_i1.p1  ORF type:complete len:546 (+),score=172.23 TRINITY_DN6422_c0_g2_i1:71-1708(+)
MAEQALQEELDAEIEARRRLEADLNKSAELGQDLLKRNQELEQTLEALRRKVEAQEHDDRGRKVGFRGSVSGVSRTRSRRTSSSFGHRRSSAAFGHRPSTSKHGQESDDETLARPTARKPKGKGHKTMLVEELLHHNQTLEDEMQRLRDERKELQHKGHDDSDDEQHSREGSAEEKEFQTGRRGGLKTPHAPIQMGANRSRSGLGEEDSYSEDEDEIKAELEEKERLLEEQAEQMQRLEAELEARRHEAEEAHAELNTLKRGMSAIESQSKVLQRNLTAMELDNEQKTELLQVAALKEKELSYQLESKRYHMKPRSSNVSSVAPFDLHIPDMTSSLADELQDLQGAEETDSISQNHAAELLEQKVALESELADLRQALAAMKLEQAKSQQEAASLSILKEAAQAKEEAAARELSLVRQELDRAEAAKAELSRVRRELEQAEAAQAELSRARQELERAEASKVQSKAEMDAAQEENAQLKQQMLSLKDVVLRLQAGPNEEPPRQQSWWDSVFQSIACGRSASSLSTPAKASRERTSFAATGSPAQS